MSVVRMMMLSCLWSLVEGSLCTAYRAGVALSIAASWGSDCLCFLYHFWWCQCRCLNYRIILIAKPHFFSSFTPSNQHISSFLSTHNPLSSFLPISSKTPSSGIHLKTVPTASLLLNFNSKRPGERTPNMATSLIYEFQYFLPYNPSVVSSIQESEELLLLCFFFLFSSLSFDLFFLSKSLAVYISWLWGIGCGRDHCCRFCVCAWPFCGDLSPQI